MGQVKVSVEKAFELIAKGILKPSDFGPDLHTQTNLNKWCKNE